MQNYLDNGSGFDYFRGETKNDMKNRFLKIVITAKNQVQYFAGDGIWFGRISKEKFQSKLADGCTVFETVNHLPENVIQFA